MAALRYLLIFVLPIAIALLLHMGTAALRFAAYQEATDWLNLALSSDAGISAGAYESLASGKKFHYSILLDWVVAGSILLGGAISALLVPTRSSAEIKARLLSTMTSGFIAAKILIGFVWMDWIEFGPWLVGALICAAIVVVLRSAFRNRVRVS